MAPNKYKTPKQSISPVLYRGSMADFPRAAEVDPRHKTGGIT
ncbi:MAG: hypothetical protein ACI9MU_004050 [Alphaproteobacteria bacterium]